MAVGCGSTISNRTITIVYSGNLGGEIEPCGCSESGNFGGILRRANVVDSLRKEVKNIVILSTGGLLAAEVPQDRIKGEYILKGLKAIRYDSIGIQLSDLSFGADFLKDQSLPYVSSNWTGKEFENWRVVKRKNVTLSIFSWLDPDTQLQETMHDRHLVSNDVVSMELQLLEAKEKKQLTVLTSTLAIEEAQDLFSLENVDILLVRAEDELIADPLLYDGTLVLRHGLRGMRLGRLALEVDANGNIDVWENTSISLSPEVGEWPRLASWYAKYNISIRESYEEQVAIMEKNQSGESPYLGVDSCKSCHSTAYDTWSESKHFEAFNALKEVDKAFDPSCLPCHTVGFKEPGGFIDPIVTPKLADVQCESCHGAAKPHVKSAGTEPVAYPGSPMERICLQCPTHTNSPDFSRISFW